MIIVENLYKKYDSSKKALFESLSLEVADSEIAVILGRTGCGKTTLLNIMAGLESYQHGTIKIVDNNGKKTEPSLIQQNHLLLPWLTVYDNIVLPLKLKKFGDTEIKTIIEKYMDRFYLTEHLTKYPFQISGGARQRVSLLRAILCNLQVVLLDEPFSTLDAFTKNQLQKFTKKLFSENYSSVIWVTHDVEEALIMADKLYILDHKTGILGFQFNNSKEASEVDWEYKPKFLELKRRLVKLI